jgi:hypothetical protein
MSIRKATACIAYTTHMKLFGGINLLVDVFLWLEVDSLEGGLQ